jgi:hypothetical protein
MGLLRTTESSSIPRLTAGTSQNRKQPGEREELAKDLLLLGMGGSTHSGEVLRRILVSSTVFPMTAWIFWTRYFFLAQEAPVTARQQQGLLTI